MSAPPVTPQPEPTSPARTLGRLRFTLIAILAGLLVASLAGIWLTRDAMLNFSFMRSQGGRNRAAVHKAIVDQTPWQTAQALAAVAVTAEEQEYARDAERLAAHQVDQAFATALRQASLSATHRTLTGKALALSQRVQQLQDLVSEDKSLVQVLTPPKDAAGSNAAHFDEDDLAVAKAQLDIDSDQLDDAQNELNRATGDNRADIQAELAAHEAAMRKYESDAASRGEVAVISVARHSTLAGRIGAWFNQSSRINLLNEAQQRTNDNVAKLTAERAAQDAAANASQKTISSAHERTEILAAMQEQRTQRQLLSIYDDRIETGQQLSAIYAKWATQVQLQHRILLHLILRSLALVLFILILTVLGDAIVRRVMALPSIGRRQMHTLRMVLELGVQVLGALLILFVIFGMPQQTPTILGLVTAGITIVLQDFILAFFGWFFLMGKNGMRVGDWVEINGVGCEVTEIGIIYTTLLETGALNDKGLPTGRRIAFLNSFAIRGQYFNFTTSGQWMWDEFAVAVPATSDPRAVLERINKVVVDDTAADARIAEQEWSRVTRGDAMSRFRAEPVVTLRPAGTGNEIQVRYMTRASNRFDTRNLIYQRVIDILREPAVNKTNG